jgi:hypothetical protein
MQRRFRHRGCNGTVQRPRQLTATPSQSPLAAQDQAPAKLSKGEFMLWPLPASGVALGTFAFVVAHGVSRDRLDARSRLRGYQSSSW